MRPDTNLSHQQVNKHDLNFGLTLFTWETEVNKSSNFYSHAHFGHVRPKKYMAREASLAIYFFGPPFIAAYTYWHLAVHHRQIWSSSRWNNFF